MLLTFQDSNSKLFPPVVPLLQSFLSSFSYIDIIFSLGYLESHSCLYCSEGSEGFKWSLFAEFRSFLTMASSFLGFLPSISNHSVYPTLCSLSLQAKKTAQTNEPTVSFFFFFAWVLALHVACNLGISSGDKLHSVMGQYFCLLLVTVQCLQTLLFPSSICRNTSLSKSCFYPAGIGTPIHYFDFRYPNSFTALFPVTISYP